MDKIDIVLRPLEKLVFEVTEEGKVSLDGDKCEGKYPMIIRMFNKGESTATVADETGLYYCIEAGENDNFGSDSFYYFTGNLDISFINDAAEPKKNKLLFWIWYIKQSE